MKKTIMCFLVVMLSFPIISFGSNDPVFCDKDFIRIVKNETSILLRMFDFQDKNLLYSLYDGTYGSENDINRVLAERVLGYKSLKEYNEDMNKMTKEFLLFARKRSDYSLSELLEIKYTAILNEISITTNMVVAAGSCDSEAAACHAACGTGGGFGAIVVGLCHYYCMGQKLICDLENLPLPTGDQ